MISHDHYCVEFGTLWGWVTNSAEALWGIAPWQRNLLTGGEGLPRERGGAMLFRCWSEPARSHIVSIRHCPGKRRVSKYRWRLSVSFLLGPAEFIAQQCVVLGRIECVISCGRGKCQFADINFVVIQIKVNAHISEVF